MKHHFLVGVLASAGSRNFNGTPFMTTWPAVSADAAAAVPVLGPASDSVSAPDSPKFACSRTPKLAAVVTPSGASVASFGRVVCLGDRSLLCLAGGDRSLVDCRAGDLDLDLETDLLRDFLCVEYSGIV